MCLDLYGVSNGSNLTVVAGISLIRMDVRCVSVGIAEVRMVCANFPINHGKSYVSFGGSASACD